MRQKVAEQLRRDQLMQQKLWETHDVKNALLGVQQAQGHLIREQMCVCVCVCACAAKIVKRRADAAKLRKTPVVRGNSS
jgi:hypothetical protein